MSEQNVELHRRIEGAFNRRDMEAMISCLDSSVEYYPLLSAIGVTVYHGHDGLRSWFGQLDDAWEELPCRGRGLLRPRRADAPLLRAAWARKTQRGGGSDARGAGVQVARRPWRLCQAICAPRGRGEDLGVPEDALKPIT